jgi:hypothetical protein
METPALAQLMGAYLHQDYGLLGGVPENVDAFVDDEPALSQLLPGEIAWALEAHPDEQALDAFLSSLGCQVPPGEGGYRQLLGEIAARIDHD